MPSLVALSEENTEKSLYCDIFPESCPICHRKIIPEFKKAFLDTRRYKESLQVIFRCPDDACRSVFIGYYNGKYGFPPKFDYSFCKPKILIPRILPDILKNISPNFIEIYNQSNSAEQLGLTVICGAGYRKALEFLIKDYLILKKPRLAKRIEQEFLGVVIEKRVLNKQIREVAKRAAWLGNDEIHYERIWIDKGVKDLKQAIDIVVDWIKTDHSAEEFFKNMPERFIKE